MGRTARKISNLVIDEVSLVDKGANQHAVVTIAKNAEGDNKESEMDIFDEQGNQLDIAECSEGDVVYDQEGNAYALELDDSTEQEQEEREPELVGKSAYSTPFGRTETKTEEDFVTSVREELSKALTDKDRDEVITKALGRVEHMSQQLEVSKRLAEEERDLRLTREYTEIAKSYNLPVEDDVLGRVLKNCAERLDEADCEVIHKAFSTAGDAIFAEYGSIGGGDNVDIYEQVSAAVDSEVSKSGQSREEAMAAFFDANPGAYDEYLAERG